MSNIETKLNAVMRCLTAADNDTYQKSVAEVRRLMHECGAEPISEPKSVEDITIDILAELGVPARIKGHRCLIAAISAVVDNPDLNNGITKELYPLVGKKCNTTGACAERAMRHAIEVAFERCSFEVIDKYFGNTISLDSGKPTNGEFIAQMAITVKRRMKGVA